MYAFLKPTIMTWCVDGRCFVILSQHFLFISYFIHNFDTQKDQRKLGMSMNVERSTIEQVRERIARNKAILLQNKKVKALTRADFEAHIAELQKAEEEKKVCCFHVFFWEKTRP